MISKELNQSLSSKEQQLANRTLAIEAAVKMGLELASILDPQQLFSTIVQQLQLTFHYSHVHIYILNDKEKKLVMKGGTGQVGEAMVANGYTALLGNAQIGCAVETTRPVIIPDTSDAPNWIPNPFLPDIKSEIVLPMKVGDEILGVLNVFQDQAGLSQEDVDLLQLVSTQAAVAIRNAFLYEQVQHRAENEQQLNTTAQLIQATNSIEQAIRVTSREVSHLFRAPVQFTVNPNISQEGWNQYLESPLESLNYSYDQNRVLSTKLDLPVPEKKNLTIRGEVLGEVSIYKDLPLSEEADSLVSTIIERLGSHIEKLRLITQTQKALNETDVLLNIIADLNAAQNYQDVITAISSRTILSAANQSLMLCLFDQPLSQGQRPEWIKPMAHKADLPVEISPRYQLSAFEVRPNTLFTEKVIVIEETSTDNRFDHVTRKLFQDVFHSTTAVIIPLILAERSIGFILANYSDRVKFSIADINRLGVISSQVAITVQGLVLLELAQSQARREQMIREITAASSMVLEPRQLLQSVVDLAKDNFSLYHVQVYLMDENERKLVLAAESGNIGRSLIAEEWIIGLDDSSIVSRAATLREGQIMNNLQEDSGQETSLSLPATACEMAIPMIVGNRLLGIFDVQSDRPSFFSEDDLQTFTTLATQTAIALQNAQLFSEQALTLERLQELDRLKSSFLATMSHELRTPLNSILGFTQVILEGIDGPVTEFMEADLRLIERNGQHLLNLINEVLDMAKIESGRISISFEPVNIRNVLQDVIDTISPQAKNKHLFIHFDILPDDDLLISADPIRIRQVILNLVGNAIKFTDKGGISITVRKTTEKVFCHISDTGLGIPPDKLEAIFEAFSQVDNSTTRKANGTGLGLSISRRFVELHGGRLWADSKGVGEGSTFHLEIPIRPYIS